MNCMYRVIPCCLQKYSQNFRSKFLEIYELHPSYFLSAPEQSCQTSLKKTEVGLELFTNMKILLMVEKSFRRKLCQAVHRYAKASNTYTKDYNLSTEWQNLIYWDIKNLYRWVISQKLLVYGFKWKEKELQIHLEIHTKL